MIPVEKTISDNPFVDNMMYYAKYIALNCTVKNEKEALANETVESMKAGDIYIACYEGKANYELFTSFPIEILEKYITKESNLDLMVNNPAALIAHLNSYGEYDRIRIQNNLNRIAQSVYMDHYTIMMEYIESSDPEWVTNNKPLYDNCSNGTATYKELFNIMPLHTRRRILVQYLNNYDNSEIEPLISSLNALEEYINKRVDEVIKVEVENINMAMRNVFKSHYETMINRGYVRTDGENNWYEYDQFVDVYNQCINKSASYVDLFGLFPQDDLIESLNEAIDPSIVNQYKLYNDVDALIEYFDTVSTNRSEEVSKLNSIMMTKYINNYNQYLNYDVYNKCDNNMIDYFELINYMPPETMKMILNTQFEEETNLKVYSVSKEMLNSYFGSLSYAEAAKIKNNIAKDMMPWYLKNHVETNNYYRTFIGLPPLKSNGTPYIDTLIHSEIENSNEDFMEFGTKFVDENAIPKGIYPDVHWRSELHEFDAYDISILTQYGILDKYIEDCNSDIYSSRYSYIRFLGDAKLDLYTCRKAMNFQLMGVPTVDSTDAKNKFTSAFAINRDYVLRTVYSDAYDFQSDYYDNFMIIFIIINTIMDVLSEIPKMIIDRDVFDSRCIKYLFESFGIPYYSEIPLKYQKAMLKNLNLLIKYKSSTRNMIDICNLFGFADIRVFGYYLFKSKVKDINTGEYKFNIDTEINYDLDKLFVKDINGEFKDYNGISYSRLLDYRNYTKERYLKDISVAVVDSNGEPVKDSNGNIKTETKTIINNKEEVYIRNSYQDDYFVSLSETDYFKKIKANINTADLKFIKVPINDSLTDYKNDDEYIMNYDEIVYEDDTWDGGLQHEEIRQQIKEYEFNAALTKYISVETVTEMTELSFQVSYFYNMIFDNLYSEENLTMKIPYIKSGHMFKFMDVICYLFSLMYLYNGIEDNIMYSPTQILYLKGYNFDYSINTILKDETAFTQTSDPMKQENIFDINARIEEDGYNYQEAFSDKKIKEFNLQVDMDELDNWLSQYQLSLDDFIVYDKDDAILNGFTQEITLRNFYSLFNSFYQKNIFQDNLLPTQYNNELKYAFDYKIYQKQYINDINKIPHEYIMIEYVIPAEEIIMLMKASNNYSATTYTAEIENTLETLLGYYSYIDKDPKPEVVVIKYYMEVFDTKDSIIYIMDNFKYSVIELENFAVYRKYIKNNDGNYVLYDVDTYRYIKNDNEEYEYKKILSEYTEVNGVLVDNIYIKNNNSEYVFATDTYYRKDDDENYIVIDNDINFYIDSNNKKIIRYGIYYILQDGKYVLDPDNCYVYDKTYHKYVLERDKEQNTQISEYDCYILHSDGHFIPLVDTDYYRKQPDGSYKYDEEICYMKSPNNNTTEYYDASESPRVYYVKLTDYYKNNNHDYSKEHYVLDAEGQYIMEDYLVSPENCYFKKDNLYYMVKDNLIKFISYDDPMDLRYNLILQDNNEYNRYEIKKRKDSGPFVIMDYINTPEENIRYIKHSNKDYVTSLLTDAKYEQTKRMIVSFNKEVNTGMEFEDTNGKYNPEETDKVWDENDWFYTDPSYSDDSIGMNGENTWYYRKPGSTQEPDEEIPEEDIGSGFYLSAETYIGSTVLEKGSKYYMAMDVETNFDGVLQIYCESDSSYVDSQSMTYDVKAGVQFHVAQVFICNEITRPRIKFLIYDFKVHPINIGDYIVASNIRFVKGFNNEYIAQDIPSYDKLQEIYRTNEAIYKYLVTKMAQCSDYDTYQIYKHLYDSMMTAKYNKEAFKLRDGTYAKTYTDFLQTRDSVLFERLTYFKSLDIETMHKQVADNIIEVTYAIDAYVDTYSYGYLYSYFPAVSANYIQQYISKIINFFKSWKVHLLGINTIYKFDDELENTIRVLEDQQYRNRLDNQIDFCYIHDSAKINPIDSYSPDGHKYNEKYKDMVDFSNKYDDKVEIRDRVRIIRTTPDEIEYTDNYENINVVLTNDDIKLSKTLDGNIIVNDTSGISVAIPNDLILEAIYDQNKIGSQPIGQINYDTMDIIERGN